MTGVLYTTGVATDLVEKKRMKVLTKHFTGVTLLALTSYSQAAVDVTGFTIAGGGTPLGLLLIMAIIAGLGMSSLKRS